VITLSYKMEFETTKNIFEYEALVLGLRVAKDMDIDCLEVFCDM
jgi:ribonuclease HI